MTEDLFQLGVKVLIIDRATTELLLLRVNVEGFKKQTHSYWDIPGGRVQRGDTVAATLHREIEEETGIGKLANLQLLTTVVSNIRIPYKNTDAGLLLQVHTAIVDEKPEVYISSEHTDYAWVTRHEAATRLQVKYPTAFINRLKSRELL